MNDSGIPFLEPLLARCLSDADTTAMDRLVADERARILDPDHLVAEVIGETEFEWDFRCLDAGLAELVAPYWCVPGPARLLLASALRALDADTATNRQAAIITEFVHYGSLINDFYTCHPDLIGEAVDRRRAHALTQVRYAGQFLTVYPRYLLARHRFGDDTERQNLLHQTIADIAVVQGISRGQFLQWGRRGFAGTRIGQHQQHAINSLSGYVVLPVLLALTLAGRNQAALDAVKPALGYLAVAVKCHLERAALAAGTGSEAWPAGCRDAMCVLALPGMALAHNGVDLDATPARGDRFPAPHRLFGAALEAAGPDGMAVYNPLIEANLEHFVAALRRAGVLVDWGEAVAGRFMEQEKEHGHA